MLLVRAIHFGATIVGGGAFAFLFFAARVASHAEEVQAARAEVERSLRRLIGWSLVVALLSWLAWLGLVSANMSGRPLSQALATEIVSTVLTRTTFGQVWLVRLVLMVLLAGELLLSHRRARAVIQGLRPAGAALAGCLLVTLAWSGHAVGTERSTRMLHLAADGAHLLAAGLWLGALVPLLYVLGRARTPGPSGWTALAAAATQRFSTLGVVAITTLLVTGIVNTWFLVGSVPALVETAYGQLLSIKIALFGAIVSIAAVNRLRLRPRLVASADSGNAPRRAVDPLWRNVIAEICLGACVLLIVGALGVMHPPFQMRFPVQPHMHGARAVPGSAASIPLDGIADPPLGHFAAGLIFGGR